jgi:hypothetical protein
VEQPARYPVLVTASLHVTGRILGRKLDALVCGHVSRV